MRSKVLSIVSDNYGVDEDKLTDDTSFTDDLGGDSLHHVEMMLAIEAEFGAYDESNDINIKTVGDLMSAVEYHNERADPNG